MWHEKAKGGDTLMEYHSDTEEKIGIEISNLNSKICIQINCIIIIVCLSHTQKLDSNQHNGLSTPYTVLNQMYKLSQTP